MKKLLRFLSLLMLLIGLCAVTVPCLTAAEEQGARLVCLNIGKADCLLLLWEDHAYLIDTGYEQNYPAIELMLAHYGVERLDGVFLTHCHKDHEGGLMKLAMSDISIDAWYAAAIFYDVKTDRHPMALAAALREDTVEWLVCGDVIPVGGNASFTVLGPVSVNEENENNNSLVLRFSCPEGSILLAGDMKEEEEQDLLALGLLSPCELLKAGHHGDNGATKKAFLSVVHPRFALISTDSHEEHDTPAPSTLERLTKIGCKFSVTQDAQDALEAVLSDHQVTVNDVAWHGVPARCTAVSAESDTENALLILRNDSDNTVALSGSTLYFSRGSDLYPLPDIVLAPGETFRIGGKKTEAECDLRLDKKKLWNEKKQDIATLYDACGRGIAWANNGIEDD